MEENYSNLNENLKNIHKLMRDIKLNPIENNKNEFWENLVDKRIDIIKIEIQNKNNVIDNGFGDSG